VTVIKVIDDVEQLMERFTVVHILPLSLPNHKPASPNTMAVVFAERRPRFVVQAEVL
tara:strand:- start:5648 stop:5818 length:171 start_codon:yes stop_codon:yes gene_type:complete